MKKTSKRPPNAVLAIGFAMALFIGILVMSYVVAKKANPVILDERGNVRGAAPASGRP